MLKGIPKIISPELMKTLMEMGHGDEIVIADGNFPAVTFSKRLIRCDGHGIPEILDAILKFLPLDTYAERPVLLMEVVKGDDVKPAIWEEYKKIIKNNAGNAVEIGFLERFDFYERASKAFAVVATSEESLYANIILRKGVVKVDS
ncbi:RbsD/FucU family protein [Caldanaerobius polysaccharolyticus]|uniref:RbsD/FucU family protein n=1 Tax=Caldanaerobius polysaccharolyticus TaxID=44256 RepID=UPI00047D95A2|nr:RbsD/FucU domain-containing protein [Caldanaerobius polysaccharolyticus]